MIATIKYIKIIVWCCSDVRRGREVTRGLEVETMIVRDLRGEKEAGLTRARAIWQAHIARCMQERAYASQESESPR